MRILAVDTSSQSASCALTEDGRLLGECFTNVRLTLFLLKTLGLV